MLRVGLVAAVAGILGIALTGCTAALSSNSSSDQHQALNFESDPPGAEIRTVEGQTCITPCELTVPSHEQPVTVTKPDYVSQTVQITVGPQPDHSFWQNPPPTLVPNPLRVTLLPVPKPEPKPVPKPKQKPEHHAHGHKMKPVHHARGHRSVSKTHTAQATPPRQKPAPTTQEPDLSPWPPSPSAQVLQK